jgi:hypothetical protein
MSKISRRMLVVSLLLSALSAAIYLGYCRYQPGHLGFPLDDGWIHQTYARNLVRYGQFAYNPGQPSPGSTAPLWTLLLSLAYLLGLDFKLWTYLLGAICLALTGWMAWRLGERLFPGRKWVAVLMGLYCLLEWHLAWAAFSGMETVLFIFLSLLLVERYLAVTEKEMEEARALVPGRYLQLGFMGGLLTLTRPEGVGLLGLIGLAEGLRRRKLSVVRRWLGLGLGFALPVAPYLAFNLTATGLIFPNTFYAKQAEYQVLMEALSPPRRVLNVISVTLVGAQVLLLPGFALSVYEFLKGKRPERLLPLAWWAIFLAVYALRLPVTYQHGRYLIPTIPFFVPYGLGGTVALLRLSPDRLVVRILGRVLLIATLLVLVIFWAVLGPRAYATDVGFIEGEMVTTARWVREHTPRTALIAVHDIGAIGYYADRALVDLAGLITPQVIPFIRDEDRLLSFIKTEGADYLVTFPSWYPRLVQDPHLRAVFRTEYNWTMEMGMDNMVVYEARWEAEGK